MGTSVGRRPTFIAMNSASERRSPVKKPDEKKRGPGKPPVALEDRLSKSVPIHMTAADKALFEAFVATRPKMSLGSFFREAGRAFIEQEKLK
jgi:hypothetical protein